MTFEEWIVQFYTPTMAAIIPPHLKHAHEQAYQAGYDAAVADLVDMHKNTVTHALLIRKEQQYGTQGTREES